MVLIFVLTVIFGILFANQMFPKGLEACEKQHKWILRDTLVDDKKCFLVCKVCGKIPGDNDAE